MTDNNDAKDAVEHSCCMSKTTKPGSGFQGCIRSTM